MCGTTGTRTGAGTTTTGAGATITPRSAAAPGRDPAIIADIAAAAVKTPVLFMPCSRAEMSPIGTHEASPTPPAVRSVNHNERLLGSLQRDAPAFTPRQPRPEHGFAHAKACGSP